jgi:hypothetical protein
MYGASSTGSWYDCQCKKDKLGQILLYCKSFTLDFERAPHVLLQGIGYWETSIAQVYVLAARIVN